MLNPDSQRHRQIRSGIRIFGIALTVTGGLMILAGCAAFLELLGGDQNGFPGRDHSSAFSRFAFAVFGLPIFCLGLQMLAAGFFDKILRYKANATAPVATDTFNYIARETKDSIGDLARTVADNLSDSATTVAHPHHACQRCGAEVSGDANFCDQCGTRLNQQLKCPACQAENDPDARFCHRCGTTIRG